MSRQNSPHMIPFFTVEDDFELIENWSLSKRKEYERILRNRNTSRCPSSVVKRTQKHTSRRTNEWSNSNGTPVLAVKDDNELRESWCLIRTSDSSVEAATGISSISFKLVFGNEDIECAKPIDLVVSEAELAGTCDILGVKELDTNLEINPACPISDDDNVVVKSEPEDQSILTSESDVKSEPGDADIVEYRVTEQPGTIDDYEREQGSSDLSAIDACFQIHDDFLNTQDRKIAYDSKITSHMGEEENNNKEYSSKTKPKYKTKCSQKCDLDSKETVHTGEITITSEFRNMQFNSERDSTRHVKNPQAKKRRTRHKKVHTRRFTCEFCDVRFPNKNSFLIHERYRKRTGFKLHFCETCNERFCHKINLIEHLRIHAGQNVITSTFISDEKTHTGEVFSSQDEELNSVTYKCTNTVKEMYTCKMCLLQFVYEASYISHLQKHKRVKKLYTCKVCYEGFENVKNLTYHSLIHSEEPIFKCTICDEQFMNAHRLKEHLRSHSTKNIYNCEICKIQYNTKHLLTRHEITHAFDKGIVSSDDEKPNLVTYQRVRTGEKFSCDICRKEFTKQCNLTQHMRLLHAG